MKYIQKINSNKNLKSALLCVIWLGIVVVCLCVIACFVHKIDPYMHFHKPKTDMYYYNLNNQRSQNNGIVRYFDYDALITGTSMTENFKASEFDKIFGVHSIKVSYSGGSYKEINDNIAFALKCNSNLKIIVRSLDGSKFLEDKDAMRTDLGKYPTYLYDKNPLNDVYYIFNKDVIFTRCYTMARGNDVPGFVGGITSFDDYSRWQNHYTFGAKSVIANGISFKECENQVHLTPSERERIYDNITQNVTSLARMYPDVTFYYFFPPYSAAWWVPLMGNGTIYRQFEAEEYIASLILEVPNIKLFSFNMCTDITTDLDNYKDTSHYGENINTYILNAMHERCGLLTKENYVQAINAEKAFYTTFDYESLNSQLE